VPPATRCSVFRDRDLALRALTVPLPARLAHAVGARATPVLGGARQRYAASVARGAMERVLGDAALAGVASERFAAGLAADDLDALRAWATPGALRRAPRVVGPVPTPGPAVLAGFHLSGGLGVFEALVRLGLSPTFLRAPAPAAASRYRRVVDAARSRFLARILARPWILTGPGARGALAEHLAAGGAIVALLDVPSAALELRDRARGKLFGREVTLPVGVLRLALGSGVPVIPFDAWIERGRRVVRFHPPAAGADVETVLASVLRTMESVVRERPWDWHAWLEIDALLGPS